MRILWDEKSRVTEVHAALNTSRDLALTTVSTLLARMEKKGLVRHRAEGRVFLYRPNVSEGEIRQSMVADLTERVFQGDVEALVSHLLGSQGVDLEDLDRVRTLIERKQRELEATDGE
ncbi:MAG: BlaI/MecI/CopY family transcriptional regulator [Candidatus Eisenbacteria bacterium]